MIRRHKLAAHPFGLSAVVALALLAPSTAAAAAPPTSAKDYAIISRDIMPSGEYGSIPTPSLLPKEEQQAEMYNALTPLFNHVTSADLLADFKPQAVGSAVPGPLTPETVPHPGVTILRDAYNVPHVYGVTRDDVTWGAGWVVAEDRGLLLTEARYIALLAAIDAPGLSAINLIGNLASFKPTAQTQTEVAKQTNVLLAAGAKGQAVLHDVDVYLQ